MSTLATNVLKGGGAFLLSSYIRGAAAATGGAPRPLLLKCNRRRRHHRHSLGVTAIARPITSTAAESGSPGRVYCTTATRNAAVDDSSSSSSGSPETAAASLSSGDETPIKDVANSLDMRVGEIVKAWTHPEADTLYVEEVDVGEPEPRIICSGLVNYLPICHLPGKKVVVLANLKPRNIRGVKSYGMLMAASDASHENVELLLPPEDSVPGERVWFGSADEKESLPDAASPNQIQKKKIWELVQPNLKTDDSCVATLGVHLMRTSAGVVACNSLKNAKIS